MIPDGGIMISQEDSTCVTPSITERREFMRLPLEERREILAQQANQTVKFYEASIEQAEREQWQGGDIVEYWYHGALSG